MDELERMLQGDRQRLGPVDSHATLARVLVRGRRRLWRRRAIGLGATAAVGAVAIAIVPISGFPTLSVDDVAGSDASPEDASATMSASPSESASSAPGPTPTGSTLEPNGVQQASPTTTPTTQPSGSSSATASPEEPPAPEWVPLTLTVTTDHDSYAQGTDVTISVRACNRTERSHEEWYPDARWRFRVQVITEDDRNIAFGQYERQDDSSTEVWAAGECSDYVLIWDQTEGPFEQDGGQQAWEGNHRIELSWWGLQPPPEGMDPGLYDPVGRESVWSPPFTIEPASAQPSPGLVPLR